MMFKAGDIVEYVGRPLPKLPPLKVLNVFHRNDGAHVRVHWRMLRWAWRHRDMREFAGQLLRITGAATKTFIGLVPMGNTGGANVSAVRPMPVDPELAAIIEAARRESAD